MSKRLLMVTAIAFLSVGGVAGGGLLTSSQVCAAEEQVSFKEDILPLFKWRCAGCHEAGGEGLTKSGVDSSLVNMRLGIALASSGDRAGAEAAFKAVSGPRGELAALWMAWLSRGA